MRARESARILIEGEYVFLWGDDFNLGPHHLRVADVLSCVGICAVESGSAWAWDIAFRSRGDYSDLLQKPKLVGKEFFNCPRSQVPGGDHGISNRWQERSIASSPRTQSPASSFPA